MAAERRLAGIFEEAGRRKVVRTGLMYGGVSLALATGAEYIFPALLLPDIAFRILVILLILGFPLALVLAWSFDITPALETDATELHAAGNRRAADAHGAPPQVRHAARPEPSDPQPEPSAAAEAPAGPPDPERVRKAALANLRQELLTPIDAIAGYGEMLLQDARATGLEDAAEILAKMHRAGGELRSMASSFLDPDGMLATETADPASISSHIRHELRNPVNALIGYAELLKEDGCVEGDLHRLEPDLDRLLEAAHRVNGLIARIAAFPVADPDGESPEIAASAEVARDVLAKIRPRDEANAAVQEGTLLVVDDNATNRDLLSRRLAREGFTVVTAESGKHAMDLVAERKIDLVLLDVLMPELDGIEVLRRLKADSRTAPIPVIMLTALDEIDSAVACVEMGAEDFLPKSFDPVLLRVRINSCLELRRLRDRGRAYERSLDEERALTEHLLGSVCPPPFATRLLSGEVDIVDEIPEAAVVAGLLDGVRPPGGDARAAVERVRALLGRLEALAPAHGVHFLRVDGDGFVAAAGLTEGDADPEAHAAAFALAARDETRRFAEEEDRPVQIRIGLHAGRLMAGLLQTGRLAFDAWGDAIDTARAIAARAEAGAIQVSPKAYAALRQSHALEPSGEFELEGVGRIRLFTLQRRAAPPA